MANATANWTDLTSSADRSSDVIAGIVTLCVGVFCFLVGFTGNGLVVLIYTVSPSLKKAHNIFIVNLAIIDMTILSLSSPVVLTVHFGDGGRLLKSNHSLCTFVGILCAVVYTVSASAMASIAINRYVCINWPMKSKKYFTTKRCIFFVTLTWIYEIVVHLPNVWGWGYIKYDRAMAFCVLDVNLSPSFNIFSLFFAVFLPTLVTLICYVGILMKVRQSRRQLHAHQSKGTATIKKGELKLAFQMLIIVLIFYLTWAPYIIIVRMYTGVVTWYLKSFISIALALNSMVNPFVYFYYNRTFREEFLRIICCRRIDPSMEGQQLGNTTIQTVS